jgi:hypothetical protein
VGAFDSAWRTVCEYLLQIKDDNQVLLKKFLNEWGVAKVWAARALDTRNSHLPSESILTKNQVYFTAAKKGVLENAANAATAENARIAAEALRRATAKANQERDAMAQLALTSAKAKADIAIEKRDAAVAAWRAVADQARVGLVLAEAVAAGALVRSIQAISAYNPLVQAGDRLVPLVLVGGRNPGDWARLANIAAAAAHTALAANGANGQTNVNAGVVDAMKAARSLAYA